MTYDVHKIMWALTLAKWNYQRTGSARYLKQVTALRGLLEVAK